LAASATAALADGWPPAAAPALYVTHNHGLAIAIPPGLTYCPLPNDWVGSDHGVELYLGRPAQCLGAGYASSGRGVTPETPTISIYYEYVTSDYVERRPCLRRLGGLTLFGRRQRGCERRDGDWVTVDVGSRYSYGDSPEELALTLRTNPERLARDLPVFAALARGAKVCLPHWAAGHTPPPCPDAQWF
jgi:hypothetical protein